MGRLSKSCPSGSCFILSFTPPIKVKIPSKQSGGTLSVVAIADSGSDKLHKKLKNSKAKSDRSKLQSKSMNKFVKNNGDLVHKSERDSTSLSLDAAEREVIDESFDLTTVRLD